MAQRVRIGCINKNDRLNPYERITHIGGVNHDSSRWKMTQQQAISDIESSKYSFYVVDKQGHEADVIVRVSKYGNKYIKTVPDGDEPNNLLSLPECP